MTVSRRERAEVFSAKSDAHARGAACVAMRIARDGHEHIAAREFGSRFVDSCLEYELFMRVRESCSLISRDRAIVSGGGEQRLMRSLQRRLDNTQE